MSEKLTADTPESRAEKALVKIAAASHPSEVNKELGDVLAANDTNQFQRLLQMLIKKEEETKIRWLDEQGRRLLGQRLGIPLTF